MSDTWMNPTTSLSYTSPPPKNGSYYLIQRKRAIPVTGNVGRIYQWDTCAEFDNEADRDASLKKLRDQNPEWHLRARSAFYINGVNHTSDPTEYMDI